MGLIVGVLGRVGGLGLAGIVPLLLPPKVLFYSRKKYWRGASALDQE